MKNKLHRSFFLLVPSGNDLAEKTNLAAKQPAKLEELKNAWEKMNAEMTDTVWMPKR